MLRINFQQLRIINGNRTDLTDINIALFVASCYRTRASDY